MKLIDGKKIADDLTLKVRTEIEQLGFEPGLAVFLIGEDEASKLYVKLKEKASKEVGIDFHKYLIKETASEEEVLTAIDFINADDNVHAMLIQLPLPEGFDQQMIIDRMDPEKDVDGFHPQTLQAFLDEKSDFIPGLSLGIIRLIESTGEDLSGKEAVIVANSDVFSKPLIKLLAEKGMEVSTISPDEEDLEAITLDADILITAIGRPNFIKGSMIKDGAILIDVGTTKIGKRVVGDIDARDLTDRDVWITPVPGGVGPITVAMLLENTVKLAQKQ